MFYVYALKNLEGKIYIGQTTDLERRLFEHNYEGTGYTSKYRPWELVYKEECQTRQESMAREKYLKTGTGRDFLKEKLQSSVG